MANAITPGEASLHAHWLYDQFVHQEFEKIRQPVNHYMDTHMDDWRMSDNVIDDRPTHGPGQYDLSSGSSTTFSNMHERIRWPNGDTARIWNDPDGATNKEKGWQDPINHHPKSDPPEFIAYPTVPVTEQRQHASPIDNFPDGLGIFN